MADDLLSAAELETLLTARGPNADAGQRCGARPPVARETILPCRRPAPPRLDENLLRAVTALHERCGRQFATELSALVRRAAHVKLAAISQVTHGEFAARLDNPTCFNVLSAAPLRGPWVLEISPEILYPIIDCMLGGGRKWASIAGRPLTDIEMRLATRVTSLFVGQWRAAWHDVVELDLSVQHVACSPHASGVVKAASPVIWIRFELELSGTRGSLNLAMPADSLQAIAGQLTGEIASGDKASRRQDKSTDITSGRTSDATVELIACLAISKIAPDDVRNLAPGDTITTEQPCDAPIAVLHDGVVKFCARAGASQGRKALEIEDVVPGPDKAKHGPP